LIRQRLLEIENVNPSRAYELAANLSREQRQPLPIDKAPASLSPAVEC